MKIVHIFDVNHKYLGARSYNVATKINNGFIRNGHNVYQFFEREVARASNPLGTRKLGVGACNKKLITVCKNFRPDVIALSQADIIQAETLKNIRQLLPNIIIFQYRIDALYVESNIRHLLSKSEYLDHTFVTTAGPYLKNVANKRAGVSFIPNPVDASIDTCKNFERDDLPTDVFFAGAINNLVDRNDLRFTAPTLIKENLPHLLCEFYGNKNKIFGAAFQDALCRSKMGLNFSCKPAGVDESRNGPLYLYSSDRVGLYLGNGLLTFTSSSAYLSELYGSDTVVEVNGADDFIDKIRFYSENDNERKKIAVKGYNLCHQEFNERLVSQFMIEAASGGQYSHDYVWPTDVYIT